MEKNKEPIRLISRSTTYVVRMDEHSILTMYGTIPNWFHRLMYKLLLGWTVTKV